MARIAGISTTRDRRGNPTKITIDLRKHPQATEALKGLGLIEKGPLQREIEENPDKYMTVEELRQKLLTFVDRLPWQE